MRNAAVDACCLINLLAAGPAILNPAATFEHKLGISLYLPDIIAEEAMYIIEPDENAAGKVRKGSIDLDPFLKNGLLNKCELFSEPEKELFVQLATQLDDGEAACLSIAKTRRWSFATDDRKAI